MSRVVTRQEWGAKFGSGVLDPGPEQHVVIHHSYIPSLTAEATPAQERAAWRGIERFHVKVNEWDGIGYNFGAAQSGRLYEGRGWSYRGSHAGPVNGKSIGICILIDGTTTEPTDQVIIAVRSLISEGIRNNEISPTYKVSGHRDWMKERTCPGDKLYARLQEFRHDAGGRTGAGPGMRVWSDYFKEHLIVTRYVSDTEWYFVRSSELRNRPATRARTPFSQMPPAKWS